MTSAGSRRRVAVIGGGIAGLAAARTLAHGGVEVVVFESSTTVGGKLRTSPFHGHAAVDEGPDAFLARLPWATTLAREVGLGDTLVSPESGTASVWWGRMHDIPSGLLLGMPTDVMALARSRLISWPGKARAALEPFLPRTSIAHDSLGRYVRARFGDQVHERLVDPLVGSIYAADTDRFSLAAVPQIADLAGRSRSVLVAGRSMPSPAPSAGPVFYAPAGGLGALAEAVADDARSHGATFRTGCTVTAIEATGSGWHVEHHSGVATGDTAGDTGSGDSASGGTAFDAVILATPAAATAALVARSAPDAATLLADVETADVVMVTLAVPRSSWPERLRGRSGYLVPKPQQRLVTACSFGSQKWAHWASDDHEILRVSLGRDGLPVLGHDDETLLAAAVDEVGRHLGIDLQPSATRLTRWAGAFPQYRPQHAARVAAVEEVLPDGLVVCGASHHGIGIPACVNSAQRAAAATLARLAAVEE